MGQVCGLLEHAAGSQQVWQPSMRAANFLEAYKSFSSRDMWNAQRKYLNHAKGGIMIDYDMYALILDQPEYTRLTSWNMYSHDGQWADYRLLLGSVVAFSGMPIKEKWMLLLSFFDTSDRGVLTGDEFIVLVTTVLTAIAKVTGEVIRAKDVKEACREAVPAIVPEFKDVLDLSHSIDECFKRERLLGKQQFAKLFDAIEPTHNSLPFGERADATTLEKGGIKAKPYWVQTFVLPSGEGGRVDLSSTGKIEFSDTTSEGHAVHEPTVDEEEIAAERSFKEALAALPKVVPVDSEVINMAEKDRIKYEQRVKEAEDKVEKLNKEIEKERHMIKRERTQEIEVIEKERTDMEKQKKIYDAFDAEMELYQKLVSGDKSELHAEIHKLREKMQKQEEDFELKLQIVEAKRERDKELFAAMLSGVHQKYGKQVPSETDIHAAIANAENLYDPKNSPEAQNELMGAIWDRLGTKITEQSPNSSSADNLHAKVPDNTPMVGKQAWSAEGDWVDKPLPAKHYQVRLTRDNPEQVWGIGLWTGLDHSGNDIQVVRDVVVGSPAHEWNNEHMMGAAMMFVGDVMLKMHKVSDCECVFLFRKTESGDSVLNSEASETDGEAAEYIPVADRLG